MILKSQNIHHPHRDGAKDYEDLCRLIPATELTIEPAASGYHGPFHDFFSPICLKKHTLLGGKIKAFLLSQVSVVLIYNIYKILHRCILYRIYGDEHCKLYIISIGRCKNVQYLYKEHDGNVQYLNWPLYKHRILI